MDLAISMALASLVWIMPAGRLTPQTLWWLCWVLCPGWRWRRLHRVWQRLADISLSVENKGCFITVHSSVVGIMSETAGQKIRNEVSFRSQLLLFERNDEMESKSRLLSNHDSQMRTKKKKKKILRHFSPKLVVNPTFYIAQQMLFF